MNCGEKAMSISDPVSNDEVREAIEQYKGLSNDEGAMRDILAKFLSDRLLLLVEPEPLGSVLIDNRGEASHFKSRTRSFYGAILTDDEYQHTDEHMLYADREYEGLAPHSRALVCRLLKNV